MVSVDDLDTLDPIHYLIPIPGLDKALCLSSLEQAEAGGGILRSTWS